MDSSVVAAIIGAVIGSAASLVGTWLQSHLGRGHAREQSLQEARRTVYSKLLFTIMSEESYPPNFMPSGRFDSNIEEEVAAYNEKVSIWRKGRRELKAVASEALLLAENPDLRLRLKQFIQSNDPDLRLIGIESLMREDTGVSA